MVWMFASQGVGLYGQSSHSQFYPLFERGGDMARDEEAWGIIDLGHRKEVRGVGGVSTEREVPGG